MIPGSSKAAVGLAGLVKTLTLVGTLRLPFRDQNTRVRGHITLLATAVLNVLPEIKHATQNLFAVYSPKLKGLAFEKASATVVSVKGSGSGHRCVFHTAGEVL